MISKTFDKNDLIQTAQVTPAAISEWRPFLASRGIMKVANNPHRSQLMLR